MEEEAGGICCCEAELRGVGEELDVGGQWTVDSGQMTDLIMTLRTAGQEQERRGLREEQIANNDFSGWGLLVGASRRSSLHTYLCTGAHPAGESGRQL